MKWTIILAYILTTGWANAQPNILVLKREMRLEIREGKNVIAAFAICSLADRNFPKRKAGDQRTPEGEYKINFINRHSASYKTIGINYPNAEDKKRGYTGSGIGIHGKCCSVGCIGMTNPDMDAILRILDSMKVKTCPVIILPTLDMEWIRKQGKLYPEYRGHYEAMLRLVEKS